MKKNILIIVLLHLCLFAFPQKESVKDLENRRKKIYLEIETTNSLLLNTKKTTGTLLARIELISKQINDRQVLVALLNREIDNVTLEHKKTEQEINRLAKELDGKKENYAVAIQGMIRKKQNKNKLFFILSGKSMGELLRRMKYLREYSEWRNQQAEEIIEAAKELEEKKKSLEKQKADKLLLLAERRKEQNNLKAEEQQKQAEMKEAAGKQKELQEIIRQKQKQANALNVQIEKLIAEDIARQKREEKRIAEEKAKTSGKTVAEETASIQNENIKLSGNFASNKGKLPMPVTGRGTITSRFGTRRQGRVETKDNGVNIQAQKGAEARCVFEGEVTIIKAFPGYNNYVIVRHGNYYTFYANIRQVYVKIGQKVSAGKTLGKLYTDSDTGRSELHFELWQGTSKLNPEPWLKR